MFGFDKMFDFNRDGKLDSLERAVQFQFMDEMMKDDEKNIGNILLFIFGGLLGGLAWFFAGCIWCITIIGIPVGL